MREIDVRQVDALSPEGDHSLFDSILSYLLSHFGDHAVSDHFQNVDEASVEFQGGHLLDVEALFSEYESLGPIQNRGQLFHDFRTPALFDTLKIAEFDLYDACLLLIDDYLHFQRLLHLSKHLMLALHQTRNLLQSS